jgi:hypothetical protein
VYLAHEHLKYHIENAMKSALKDVNSQITGGGIEAAVKQSLAEVQTKLRSEVKV